MEKIINIGLAILLFACLLDMPDSYFQFVRFVAFIGFGVFAYQANQQGMQLEIIIFGALALLFQPFFKVALGRELWNVVDVIIGIGLLGSFFKKKAKKRIY